MKSQQPELSLSSMLSYDVFTSQPAPYSGLTQLHHISYHASGYIFPCLLIFLYSQNIHPAHDSIHLAKFDLIFLQAPSVLGLDKTLSMVAGWQMCCTMSPLPPLSTTRLVNKPISFWLLRQMAHKLIHSLAAEMSAHFVSEEKVRTSS